MLWHDCDAPQPVRRSTQARPVCIRWRLTSGLVAGDGQTTPCARLWWGHWGPQEPPVPARQSPPRHWPAPFLFVCGLRGPSTRRREGSSAPRAPGRWSQIAPTPPSSIPRDPLSRRGVALSFRLTKQASPGPGPQVCRQTRALEKEVNTDTAQRLNQQTVEGGAGQH